jgi:AcrR family transcriptional regulator
MRVGKQVAVSESGNEEPADRRHDERYLRLLTATREAAKSGYDAVQMRELAAAARLSLKTVYNFVTSKDHLITEAHLDTMIQFRATAVRRPPRGATAAARVIDVLHKQCRALEVNRELTLTILRAMYASEPSVVASRMAVSRVNNEIIDVAIGDDDIPDRWTRIGILGCVVDVVLQRWANDDADIDEVRETLDNAAHILFDPIPTARRPTG